MGRTYTGSGTEITVNKQVNIYGGSPTNPNLQATVNANELSRMLTITATNVSVNGITFTNGKANGVYGGAILWIGANGTVNGCDFTNNYLDLTIRSHGGAIYWEGANGTIKNSHFTNNSAIHEGACWMRGSNAQVINSTFVNNTAFGYNGGALSFTELNSKVLDSKFINNTATVGGALNLMASNQTVENCIFINNTVKANGGAIYVVNNSYVSSYGEVYNITINNCNFTNNSANNGGSIHIAATNSTVDKCQFTNNNALNYGGAIYWTGANSTITNSEFYNNTASNRGGAVMVDKTLDDINLIENCTFLNNSAYIAGAVELNGHSTNPNNTINNCNFINNSAILEAGAVKCEFAGINNLIKNSNFTGNIAKDEAPISGGRSGALCFDSGAAGTVDSCNFENNIGDFGGAITFTSYATNGVNIVKNSNFTNNIAIGKNGQGGGAINANNNTITIDDCVFENNTGFRGGALYLFSKNVTITNSVFNNNIANTTGGAIMDWTEGNTTINNSNFTNNKAENGSAIYIDNRNIKLLNSFFKDNKANSSNITGKSKYNLTLTHAGNDNYINAIYANNATVNFNNVTYSNGEMVNSDAVTPIKSDNESGQNIILEVYDSNNQLVDTYSSLTDRNGQITYNYSKLPIGEYKYRAYHPDNSYYTYVETLGSFSVNKYNITAIDNKTKSGFKNRETTINATIKDHNNQTITLPADTKLVFTHKKTQK